MKKAKFNFTAVILDGGPIGASDDARMSISKNGQVILNKGAINQFGFKDVLIDIVVDVQKRALGWKKMNGMIPKEKWTPTMRKLVADKTGTIKFSVGRILNAMGIQKGAYKSLPIDKYMDLLEEREVYYVVIPKK